MFGLELIVAIGIAVLLGNLVARRFGAAVPVVLVVAGLALSLIPPLRGIGLPSEVVLILFLPPLLYWESLTTSAREIRRFLRGITLTGTLLVAFTAAVVAVVGRLCGLSWGAAWLIGAAVAPTDATAVAALGKSLSRGNLTTLRGESLINDGTALVVFALAVEAASGPADLSAWRLTGMFLLSFGGGIVVGLAVGWLIFQLRKLVSDPLLSNVIQILTPFTVYLAAEAIHASGVLAVVTSGLLMAREAPRVISAQARQQATSFWTMSTFLLNGALFVLIGMELPIAVGALTGPEILLGMFLTAVIYAAILLARFVFLNVTVGLIRAIDRRPQQRTLRGTFRGRIVSTVAGFRGGVSLAVALAVPATLPNGGGFPARDMIIFVTAGVVVTSLVLQGIALPHVIKWAHLPADTAPDEELELARRTMSREAMEALPEIARQAGINPDVVDAVEREFRDRLATWTTTYEHHSDQISSRARQYNALRLGLLAHKRETAVRLRDEAVIDDTVLRRIQAQLDVEEIRLRGPAEVE